MGAFFAIVRDRGEGLVLSVRMRIRKAAVIGLFGIAGVVCSGQDSGRRTELQESLEARYRVTVLGGGPMGVRGENSIRRAGGTVVVLREGFHGAYDRKRLTTNAVQDAKVSVVSGDKDVEIGRGEKFYVTAVYVGSDVVTLGLLSARNIPGKTKSAQVWCTVNFFLASEALSQGDMDKVDAVLDQWILPEGAGAAPAPAPAKAAVTASVETMRSSKAAELAVGLTREQVVAAMGDPLQEASFGEQRWMTYAGLTATLQQGKLTSVERNASALVPVKITSDPPGADVLLDAKFVSSTPAVLRLAGGNYKVVVKMAGYTEWEREVRILPGAEVTLDARLSK
jgi:GTP cyclohydrolase III